MTNITLFDTVIQKMTEEEANACLRRIKNHLSDARNEILALYEREGWLTLGYTSWVECVQSEFKDYSERHIYRLKEAAETERNISSGPLGQIAIPERQLRPIAQENLQQEVAPMRMCGLFSTAPNGAVDERSLQVRVVPTKRRNCCN